MHTGTGLPANGALPTFGATALECVLVPKTGPYKTSNCMTAARSLCEARLRNGDSIYDNRAMSCVANVGQGGFNARRGGFNVGQDGLGLGGTRVYDDAETAAVIQTAPSYAAQVSIIDNPDIGIGDGGNSGFGGILTTGRILIFHTIFISIPLLLLLGALGGGTTLKASPVSPDPVRPPASSCPVCPTLVPRTCPSTREQCNLKQLVQKVSLLLPMLTPETNYKVKS
ncbi:unnamed protein product [Mytilus edulis]|uniref:Uncharacterized protein n=1 Tax=Mytilus edulis TaxID=6550 RepID=A0A8S3S4K1_MYTED|nr:unnamed protein product [Mytilus edulis]